MAGVKISALPPVGSAQLTDIFPVVQSGITRRETITQLVTLLNSSSVLTGFVPINGGTMTGPLILSGDATNPLGAVTLEQLQLVAGGFTVILAALVATTSNLNATYVNGASGVGATLTNAGAQSALTIDGVLTVVGDRVLVKNQTTTFQNGVYTVTVVGTGATNWVLTRAMDYDQAPSEIKPGTLIAINSGTVNTTTSWLETATVTTVGTDPILFSQFTFSPGAFLLRANNLSDLASVSTALVNLGLGIPTGTGNVVLQTSPTLITPILGAAIATSLAFNPTTGGIIGTTAADNAGVGKVGEFITVHIPVSGPGVSLVSAISSNVTSISLSAGDWDVWGNVYIAASGATITQFYVWTSNTSATFPDLSDTCVIYHGSFASPQSGLNTPTKRYNVSGPTTVFLSTFVGFTGSCKAYGNLSARRRR